MKTGDQQGLTRVYLPATLPMVSALMGRPELGPAPLAGHAVTPALREWYTEADQEELEFVAYLRAAQEALWLLRRDPGAPRRRVVVAADVAGRNVTAVSRELGSSAVRLSEPVPLTAVATFHVDEGRSEPVVAAAADVIELAAQGDPEAQFAVDSAEDADLLWYAREELAELLKL